MSRPWTRFLLPGFLATCVVAYMLRGDPPPPPAVASAPTASAPGAGAASAGEQGPALLEGLKPGDALDEWTVERILVNQSPSNQPQLAIELGRKGSGITIWVHRKETVTNPPLATARYAFTFGHARPNGDPIPQDAYEKCMAKLAERIRRAEATAPVPEGL